MPITQSALPQTQFLHARAVDGSQENWKRLQKKRDSSFLCYLVVPKPLLVVRNNILFICSYGRSLLVLASTLSWRRVRTRSRRHTHRKCLLCFNVLVISLCLVLDLLYTWCLNRLHLYIYTVKVLTMLSCFGEWWCFCTWFTHLMFDVRRSSVGTQWLIMMSWLLDMLMSLLLLSDE